MINTYVYLEETTVCFPAANQRMLRDYTYAERYANVVFRTLKERVLGRQRQGGALCLSNISSSYQFFIILPFFPENLLTQFAVNILHYTVQYFEVYVQRWCKQTRKPAAEVKVI